MEMNSEQQEFDVAYGKVDILYVHTHNPSW